MTEEEMVGWHHLTFEAAINQIRGFPGGSVSIESARKARDLGLISGAKGPACANGADSGRGKLPSPSPDSLWPASHTRCLR